jgi:hypothetical protein
LKKENVEETQKEREVETRMVENGHVQQEWM